MQAKNNTYFTKIGVYFHSLLGVINGLFILLFILSAYSDRVSPDTSVFFSYLGLAFPILGFFNLCFVFYWLLVWKWKMLLVNIVTVLLCFGPISSYFPIHFKTKEISEENTIKVLTYNVMCFGFSNHSVDEPNKIVEYIANSEADIVCLQEYWFTNNNKFLTDIKLKRAFGMYKYRSIIPLSVVSGQTVGIAVYSKFPILSSKRIDYKSKFNGSSMHRIKIKDKTLVLFNNHLESFKLTSEDKSKYYSFIKNMNTETFDKMKVSIQEKLGPAFRIRARQAEQIAKDIAATESDYLLVCGDFNDTPISYAHRTILGNLKDAYAKSGSGLGVTYNQNLFWFRIDNIFCSKNMVPINSTVDKVRYSDHYPLWCYLELK